MQIPQATPATPSCCAALLIRLGPRGNPHEEALWARAHSSGMWDVGRGLFYS